jgi:hypothetical protein
MTSVARGILLLLLSVFIGQILISGCLNMVLKEGGIPGTGNQPTYSTPIPATATPVQPSPPAPPAVTASTPVDLSLPPETARPTTGPSVDPIVGTWYAPPPDDLTFVFYPDGTFTERSPNFRTYQGTWKISEEGEKDFYDADILDRWGYRKQAHLHYVSGTLMTKGIGEIHRVT